MKFLVLVVMLFSGACAPPPTLTPPGRVAFQVTRVVKALDTLRDIALNANAQIPPLVSDVTAGRIVRYHQATLTTLQTQVDQDNWKATASSGLKAVVATFTPDEQHTLQPYVTLVQVVLQEVP